jgi:hypothetical protein
VASLNQEEANELAADIIAVSKFYDLPLEIFLGIGAMENNYLNIRGDLKHTVWKRRAAKDDIIVRRRKHSVLVSDYSIGVWQITRETLLTTYAGLLLRDLLDRFNGDVQKAVGAYNGGPRNPNLDYAAGVQTVAEYAKNMLERVSAINGRRIAQTTFFVSRNPR